MQTASDIFSVDDRRRIEQSVHEAESKTSCEIVPVVATTSGRYDRSEDIVGLWLTVASAIAAWVLFPRKTQGPGSWESSPASIELLTFAACLIGAFIIGAFAGSRIGWLRRLFTPHKLMKEEVARRAREIFFDRRIHHTSGGTGMLIYISIFEHMAAVLGDQKVLETLGQTSMDQLCQQLIEGLRCGNPTNTICSVVAKAGDLLSGSLPRAKDDINEFQDTFVLIED